MEVFRKGIRRSTCTFLQKMFNALVIFAFLLQPFGATGFNMRVLAAEGDAVAVDVPAEAPAEEPKEEPKAEPVAPVEEPALAPEPTPAPEEPVVDPAPAPVEPVVEPVLVEEPAPTDTPTTTDETPETSLETPADITSVTPTDTTTITPAPTDTLIPAEAALPVEVAPEVPAPVVETWGVADGNKVTTNAPVVVGTTYVAPQNSEVTVTFTKLPETPGTLSIEEITLTEDQIKQTGSLSDKAYDITSDMKDGDFSYNLSLPIPESSKGKSVEVKFAEELSNIGTAEKVENNLTKTDTSVSVESLNHFTIFVVTILDPSWDAIGGGGVFSAYVGPSSYNYVSPGATALYDGREAGVIKAGLSVDPTSGNYEDEGLFAFKPTVTIDAFAAGTVTYDVENQSGVNPVWMTIEIDTGTNVGDSTLGRSDNTVYQFVPTSNPSGWHTVDAGAGLWQKWDDGMGTVTETPISLSAVAAAHPGLNVMRAYLRLGMGNSYNNSGTGTIAWVDKAILGGNTYDFTVATSAPTQIPAERLPMLGTLTGVTLTPTLGKVTILNGLPTTVSSVSNPALFTELEAQVPGLGSDANSRYVGFMINPPVIAGYEWKSDSLKETTSGFEYDYGSEDRGGSGTHDDGTELWQTVTVKSGAAYNRTYRTPKDYEITWILQKTGSLESKAVTELFTVEQVLAAPTLTVNKVCLPSSNGLERFNLQIDGANVTTDSMCGGTSGPVVVSASSHTVGEAAGSGTNLSNYTSLITGDCASNGSVTLAAGDNKTCTITNTLDTTAPTVTSVSSIINGATVYATGTSLKFNSTTPSPHTITVTFSENISNTPTIAVSGIGQTVTNCGDPDAKTFCFAYAIPAATEYTIKTVQISGAQDIALNTMLANNSHTFIVDTIVPLITISDLLPGYVLPSINIANASSYTLNGTYTELGSMGSFTWYAFKVLPSLALEAIGSPASESTTTIGTDLPWSHTWTNFSTTLAGLEGTFRIWSDVYDTANNRGYLSNDGTYDLVAPTTPGINTVTTDNIINATERTATVTVTGTNESGSTVTLNGNAVVVDTATTWHYVLTAVAIDAFGQGAETLTAIATDTAGNPNAVNGTRGITVDTTVPTVDAGSDKTKNALFTQTGTTTDSGSGVSNYTWDFISGPGLITFSNQFGSGANVDTNISASVDGTYVLQLTVSDNAGNVHFDDMTLVWDTVAPAAFTTGAVNTTSVPSPDIASYWNGTDIGAHFLVPFANDTSLTGGTMQLQANVDGGGYISFGSLYEIHPWYLNTSILFGVGSLEGIAGFSEGVSINFRAIITDRAGNSTTGGQSATTLTVDQTVPTVTAVDSDGQTYSTSTVSPHTIKVTFSEDIAIVPTISVSGGAQTVNNCSDADAKTFCFAYAIPPTQDTEKEVQVLNARDIAGNTMVNDFTHHYVVDTIVPTDPVATPAAGDYTADQSVTLASTDERGDLVAIYYTLDGTTPDNSKTLYAGAITVDHDMTIKAIAYDNVGNPSGVLEAVYGIAPVISGETSSAVSGTSVTITWTTDDLSTSRVIYGTDSVSDATVATFLDGSNYGYASSTVEDSTEVTLHSVGLTGLLSGTTYYYRTVSHGSPETVSAERTFSTSDITDPDNVKSLRAVYRPDTQDVRLTWNVDDNDTQKVYLYRGGSENFSINSSSRIAIQDDNDEAYTDDDITLGETYYYKAVARDAAGNNSDARVVKIVIPEGGTEAAVSTDEGTQAVPAGTVLGTETEAPTASTEETTTASSPEQITAPQTTNGDQGGQVLGEETSNPSEGTGLAYWQWLLIVFILGGAGYYGYGVYRGMRDNRPLR